MPDVIFEVIEEDTTVDVVVTTPVIDAGVMEDVVSIITVEGPIGPQGTPGEGAPIVGETLTGVKDGANLVFTTAHTFITNSTAVYRNGIREIRGPHYLETGPDEVTFSTAPETTDNISIDYYIG